MPSDDVQPAAPSPPHPEAALVAIPRPDVSPVDYRPQHVSSLRFVRAYTTTFQVILSYLALNWMTRLFGQAYREERMGRVHKKNARRVQATILELQGLFIKVGQLLSILANFLPEEFRSELETLQDQVPPRPYEEIKQRVESELRAPVDQLYKKFERVPIASASLGQVHEAWLHDGTRVAVKVQHRDIDEIVRLDLKTIRRIMQIVQWFVPVQGLDAYYHQVKELLEQELDFALEATNVGRISRNFTPEASVVFPQPVPALSTRRVLTSTFVVGHKLSDLAALDKLGLDKKAVATRLVRAYCQMIFVDGLYHADPHPGNVLVADNGDIVLLDFGAVAQLSPDMRAGIPEFLEGVIRRDTEKLIRAMKKMGFLSRTSDPMVTEKIIEYFHARFQEEVKLESFNLKDVKVDPGRGLENLLDLRKMNIGLRELSGAFHIPKDWVLLERTILLLYGCCSMLDGELEPMKIIQPYLQEFVLGNRDFTQIAVETLRDMAVGAMTLPDDLKKYLSRAMRGELEIRVRGLEDGSRAMYSIGRQIIYTSIGIATGLSGLNLRAHGDVTTAHWLFGVTIACAVLLVFASIFSRPSPRRWR